MMSGATHTQREHNLFFSPKCVLGNDSVIHFFNFLSNKHLKSVETKRVDRAPLNPVIQLCNRV